MYINNYINTTIWSQKKPEFVKSLNKASNKYIAEARKREKKFIKEYVTLEDPIIQHHLQQTMILETLEIILGKNLGSI